MGGFVIDKKDLTQALKEVTPCASKDEKLAPINQVQIAIIEGVPLLLATNRIICIAKRLDAVATRTGEMPNAALSLADCKSLKTWLAKKRGMVTLVFDKEHVQATQGTDRIEFNNAALAKPLDIIGMIKLTVGNATDTINTNELLPVNPHLLRHLKGIAVRPVAAEATAWVFHSLYDESIIGVVMPMCLAEEKQSIDYLRHMAGIGGAK